MPDPKIPEKAASEAPWQLAAAAPEMLAALRQLVRVWDRSTLPVSEDMQSALTDADAAIAKAEGRS